MLDRLSRGQPIDDPVLLLVAHPDDECLGLGGHLRLFTNLILVHATDGEAGDDVAERRRELDAALRACEAVPRRRVRLQLPDGQVAGHVRTLASTISDLADKVGTVITHAFEGGHPDHDACAVAVQLNRATPLSRARTDYEFPLYRPGPGRPAWLSFPDNAGRLPLAQEARALKEAALQAFASQAHVVASFPTRFEALRPVGGFEPLRPRSASEVLYPQAEAVWRQAIAGALEAQG